MPPLRVGDQAPDFTTRDHLGREFKFSSLRGRPAVVFFYPKDNTPACTAQSCSFRDAYDDFLAAGAAVVGVSTGSVEAHAGFARRQNLPFALLADDGAIRVLWRVPKTLGFIPGRVTYVIDAQGRVRHAFNSQWRVGEHVQSALRVVRSLKNHPESAPAA